ncbi:MAG: hypothetical protein Q9187_000390 [Circinaria calcarea]
MLRSRLDSILRDDGQQLRLQQCVDQTELERFDGVSQGRYTIGLGQTKMSFCDDREDIYSMALTTVSSLLRKYRIHPESVGRLEVGTETLLDKSKSCKTVLMQLFGSNTNIEGVDTVNACYGGTNAVFNSINWIESSAWDGRDAVVCAGDIALYQKGNARPTGGAGCVAMLIGPDAPLVFEPGMRGTYMKHVYDFYKADLTSEYPFVDGQFSLKCYTEAVDACYKAYHDRRTSLEQGHLPVPEDGHAMMNDHGISKDHSDLNGDGNADGTSNINNDMRSSKKLLLDHFDYLAFHTPTCKLVSKSYARMLYNDYIASPTHPLFDCLPAELRAMDYERCLGDKKVENAFLALSKEMFDARVQPSLQVPKMCGNMYCASVYGSLISLLSNIQSEQLRGKRIGIFSYGSGLASSLFSLIVKGDVGTIAHKVDLHARLEARRTVRPEIYEEMCLLREKAHLQKNSKPKGNQETLAKGTYYLVEVDEVFRRNGIYDSHDHAACPLDTEQQTREQRFQEYLREFSA